MYHKYIPLSLILDIINSRNNRNCSILFIISNSFDIFWNKDILYFIFSYIWWTFKRLRIQNQKKLIALKAHLMIKSFLKLQELMIMSCKKLLSHLKMTINIQYWMKSYLHLYIQCSCLIKITLWTWALIMKK